MAVFLSLIGCTCGTKELALILLSDHIVSADGRTCEACPFGSKTDNLGDITCRSKNQCIIVDNSITLTHHGIALLVEYKM